MTIRRAASIPKWIEFSRKMMKVNKNLENQKEWLVEALACPVDHPRVIKLLYLNTRTYESYSMWWNGGSLIRQSWTLTRAKSSKVQAMISKLGRDWLHIGRIEHI